MLLKRTFTALGSSELQLLRAQYLRSGQCARCFHASLRQSADKKSGNGNDQGTPYNAPKRGPSRQERSARISNEISMLQRGPPPSGSEDLTGPGSATGTYHAPPAAPTTSAGFMEHPEDIGGATARMGENVSMGREGPNAQGAGRPLRYEDRRADATQDQTSSVRGARAGQGVEEPAEGGASVLQGGEGVGLNPGHHQEWVQRSGRAPVQQGPKRPDPMFNQQEATRLLAALERQQALGGVPFRPRRLRLYQPNAIRAKWPETKRLTKRTPPDSKIPKDQNPTPQLTLNSTYLRTDQKQFLKTMEPLMPKATMAQLKAARQAKAANKEQAPLQ